MKCPLYMFNVFWVKMFIHVVGQKLVQYENIIFFDTGDPLLNMDTDMHMDNDNVEPEVAVVHQKLALGVLFV